MIDGLKATITGMELKESLLRLASLHKARSIESGPPHAGTLAGSHAAVAALLSYLADHVEEDEKYRIPLDQVTSLGLHTERLD